MLQLVSLKLTVRATVSDLELQIFCQDSSQNVHPYVCKRNGIQIHSTLSYITLVETTHLTALEYYISLADVRAFTFVLS